MQLGPSLDRAERLAHFAPDLHQPAAHQRVLDPVRGIKIPAIRGAPGTATRFVVRQVMPGAGVIGLLGFPGNDPGFHINLPGTGPGAVHAMGRADNFVVPPAVPVGVFPIAVFAGHLPVAIGELVQFFGLEEVQSVEQVAHISCSLGVTRPRPKGISGRGRSGFTGS